jgi:ketosteroid isomerase-like protein
MDANQKLVEDIYAAFGRGDVPFILATLAHDCDWHGTDAPEIPYSGRFRGPGEIVTFFQKMGGAIEVTAFSPKTFLSAGDVVSVTGSWSGTVRATGKSFTTNWAMRWVIRSGKVVIYDAVDDTAVTAAAFRS